MTQNYIEMVKASHLTHLFLKMSPEAQQLLIDTLKWLAASQRARNGDDPGALRACGVRACVTGAKNGAALVQE